MPMYPKILVMMMLSVMMSFSIDQGLAPMALRTPNSLVRSFTVMSMMLLTPTMPLSKVNKPTIHRAIWMMAMPWFICMLSIYRFQSQMVRSSSGAARWLLLMRAR